MPDTLLIKQCLQNNRKAQLGLYKKYADAMYTIALRYIKDPAEAEDAHQDAFIKAFKNLSSFKGEVTFGSWLKKIVINTCLDSIKAKKVDLISLQEETLRIAGDEEADWTVDDEITVTEIKNVIFHLPEKYKYPTMLFLLEGYDHSEIAEIIKIPESTSRILLHRGKKMLQDQLKHLQYGTKY